MTVPTAADPTRDFPTRQAYGWVALGVMVFTIYGSLVPFRYHARPWADAIGAFRWVIEHRTGIESRSDFVANCFLGVPLGFAIIAYFRLDRPRNVWQNLLMLAAIWPWCIAFASAVEFSQLYFPGRTSSVSDIIAQSLGSAVGIFAWIGFGQPLTTWFRGLWSSDIVGGTAGRILIVYLATLALVQWLPLDLTASPSDVYRAFRDGRVVVVPFSELANPTLPSQWGKIQSWMELGGLYTLAGLLAAWTTYFQLTRSHRFLRVFAAGLLVAFLLEFGQVLVMSRSPSVTDVLIGGVAILLGWSLGRLIRQATAHGHGLELDAMLIVLQAWMLWLVILNWQPFDFLAMIGPDRWANLNWIPFATSGDKNYLSSLEEAGTKSLLYAPFGALLTAMGTDMRRRRILYGVAVAVIVVSIIEVGQLYLPSRTPSPTDLVFAILGAIVGGFAAQRIRMAYRLAAEPSGEQTQHAPPGHDYSDPRLSFGLPLPPPRVPLPDLPDDDPIRIQLTNEGH